MLGSYADAHLYVSLYKIGAIVVLAIAWAAGAQWIDGEFTITESTCLNFPINAAQELVYSNP